MNELSSKIKIERENQMSSISHKTFNFFCRELRCPLNFWRKSEKIQIKFNHTFKKYETFTKGKDYQVECHSENHSIIQKHDSHLQIVLKIQI